VGHLWVECADYKKINARGKTETISLSETGRNATLHPDALLKDAEQGSDKNNGDMNLTLRIFEQYGTVLNPNLSMIDRIYG
jgi:hypothetical protein